MKIRESGMPAEQVWRQFFDPSTIFVIMGLDKRVNAAADFGSGYGTFSIELAKFSEKVYALDIEPDMISALMEKCEDIPNIEARCVDFMTDTTLQPKSIDLVLLFNILHTENMAALFNEVQRILKKEGKVAVIHWNYDPTTPRGPPMDVRKKPEEISAFFETNGMQTQKAVDLPPYHFGLIFTWPDQ